MFTTLLVAIDASEASACAVSKASELAEQLGARVVLLHVLDPATVVVAPELMQVYQPTLEEMKQKGQALLHDASDRISELVEVETVLLEGNPAERIVRSAADQAADLIVIGTDSRGRLAHFLLGSTADAVIRRAPCPVVAVRRSSTWPKPAVARSIFANAAAH
jgi:nucleotide-binding universal stress UspA family protein